MKRFLVIVAFTFMIEEIIKLVGRWTKSMKMNKNFANKENKIIKM